METKKEIQLSGRSTSFSWIKGKYDEGNLLICGVEVKSDDEFELLRVAIRTTNDIYEGDWDLDFNCDSRGRINIKGIILHFPLINITNRDKKSHTIKDLFVKQPFMFYPFADGNKKLQLGKPEGGRTTVSYAEYCSNYFHSHLSISLYDRNLVRDGYNIPFFTTFCTGSGEINIYLSNINADGFTEERFTQYLLQLMTMVSYESIEGTPYRYINAIKVRTKDNSSYRIPSDQDRTALIDKIIYAHKEQSKIPDVNFTIEDNKYIIKDDEKWETFLKSGVTTDEDKIRWFVGIDGGGNIFPYNNTRKTYIQPIIPETEFYFRDKTFKYCVENIPEEKIDINKDEDYHIHPAMRKIIKTKIEDEIDKYKIRKSTIDRYQNTTDNTTESIRSN